MKNCKLKNGSIVPLDEALRTMVQIKELQAMGKNDLMPALALCYLRKVALGCPFQSLNCITGPLKASNLLDAEGKIPKIVQDVVLSSIIPQDEIEEIKVDDDFILELLGNDE